jgi:hypothetical protein
MEDNALRRKLLYFVPVLLSVSAAVWAQQANRLQNRAAQDSGLEATMKYIQEKLNSIGPVYYVSQAHDSQNGHNWTNKFKDEASELIADPSACRIYYHWFTSVEGSVTMDKKLTFALKDVQQISVQTREEIFKADNAAMGRPSWTVKIEPPVYVLLVQRPAHVQNHLIFLDQDLANRVAKSLAHAVELCGGQLSH